MTRLATPPRVCRTHVAIRAGAPRAPGTRLRARARMPAHQEQEGCACDDGDAWLASSAFIVTVTHVGAHLAGRVDCNSLAALCRTCRLAHAHLAPALAARTRAVQVAATALWARTAVAWLLRPAAQLDEYVRAALYDNRGVKLAEIKLARVVSPLALHHHHAANAALEQAEPPMAVALWRCAPPWPSGSPRQAQAADLLDKQAASRALAALLRAGFRPLRRKGFYNARAWEEPLWGRP